MSEFIADARVRILPDLTKFRSELQAELLAATRSIKPIAIPVVPVSTGAATSQITQAAGAAATLTSQNKALATSAAQVAGAEATLTAATNKSSAALLGAATSSAKLDAALLGLRTALGSTAVIGLGAASLAAIVVGKAFRAIITDTAAFEQELNTFRVTAGATADQMEQVSAAAEKLGADVRLPAVSAADAAIAMTELSKAGLSVQDSIAGAAGVLELATAAQISNEEAAKLAANALNSFGLAGDQAVRVADDLANAANAAQGSISDIGIAMQQASAVARQVGLSLEDTTAILSLFAKNGLQGSDAGTSLRVALIRLVAPTQQAAAEIKKLGLQIRDAEGNVRPDVFAQFGEATKDLTPAARDAAAALIFGQDAIRAVSIGAREGVDGLKLMQFEIDQTGTAAELAGARTQGLAGSIAALQSNLQTIGITLGPLVAGPLAAFSRGIGDLTSEIAFITNKLHDLGAIKIPPITIDVGFKVTLPGGRLGSILSEGLGLGALAQITPAGAAAVAGKQIFDAFKGAPEAAKQLKTLEDELQALQKARVEAFKGGDLGLADSLTPQIEQIKRDINALKVTISDGDESIQHLRAAIKLLENTGNPEAITQLQIEINNLQAGLQASGAPVRDFSTDLDHLSASARGAASSIDATTSAAQRLAQEATTLGDKLQAAQAGGAGPQTQIGLLQQDVAAQQAIIAEAEKGGRQAGDITTIRKARAQIISDNAQIKSLESQIASDQEKTAKDIKDKRDAADQAILDTFGAREERAQNAIIRAGSSSLKRQLAAQRAFLIVLTNELFSIQKTVKDAKTRAKELARVTAEMIKVGQDIQKIRAQQRDALKKAAEDRQAALERGIQLDIDFAVTTGNKAAEIAARNREIAFLTKRLDLLKKKKHKTIEETNEIKELRNAIAEQRKALKDLAGEQKSNSNAFKEATFAFLQTQAGFAANLLGNLIPGGATAGLVGGTTTPTGGAFQLPQPPDERVGATTALAASRDRGVRPIQVDTTNQLLRHILRVLQNTNGRLGHPEARYNKLTAGAGMDTSGY